MTALTQARKVPQRGDSPVLSYDDVGQKGNTVLYPGAIVVLIGGFLAPATEAQGLVPAGIYDGPTKSDATGLADGKLTVRYRAGVHGCICATTGGDGLTQADVGKTVYLLDDQTVVKTSNGGKRSAAGPLKSIDPQYPTLAYVQIGTPSQDPAGPAPVIQTGTLTLAAGVKTVNTGITISASSKVYVSLNTPGGTLGAHHKAADADLVVGGPGTGAFVAKATDASGATVTTDTSTLNYLIIG